MRPERLAGAVNTPGGILGQQNSGIFSRGSQFPSKGSSARFDLLELERRARKASSLRAHPIGRFSARVASAASKASREWPRAASYSPRVRSSF